MEEAFIKKIQPNNIEAEKSVIGSMIMDRDAIVEAADMLTRADFYQAQYGILFEAMVELYQEGKPVDLVTLQNKLREKDVPEALMSIDFIRDLVASVPTSANAAQYAAIVKDKATLRRLIKTTEDIAAECYLSKEDTDVILEKTEKSIFISGRARSESMYSSVSSSRTISSPSSSRTVMVEGFSSLPRRYSGDTAK